ncbi:MAG TPA: BatA domain-containing protein [Gemmatimonadota bacterium]|nr:BatA domain-containing protein [Gemmatimonadota bacterium]
MIGFLHPLLALAALAAVVPIILHLIRRRDVKRLPFPAVRYLRRAERRHARRLKLRHLALLVARVSIVLILAFSAMGPLLGRGSAVDHRPTALAVVIDDSQSSTRFTGEGRLIDLFRERASRALELATGDDRIAVFSAVQPDRAAVSGFGAAHAYLSGLEPVAGRADLPLAIRRAAQWLESVGEDREQEIHVLTDLQAVSLAAATAAPVSDTEESKITAVAFAPELPELANGTPGLPQPEVHPLGAGRHTTVSVPLHWYGLAEPAEPVVVRLVKDDDVIAVAEASYGEGALFRLPPQDSGWVQGYVELDSQGLAADDRRYFSWLVRPAPRLATLGDAGTFLESALGTLASGGRLRYAAPAAAEVWISAGGERAAEAVTEGRSLIVVPPVSSLDLPRLNGRLARAGIPWSYEVIDGRGATRIADDSGMPDLGGLEVRYAYRLVPSGVGSADAVLLRLADGARWLIRGTAAGGGSYLLLASPLTPEASDLPTSAGMVPFLDALLGDWARGGISPPASLEAGAVARLPERARAVGYAGATAMAEGGAPLHPARPGNYQVVGDEGTVLAFSVNAPVAEADLTRGSESELEAILPASRWTWSRKDGVTGWEEEIFRARRGRLAWKPLVVLLLVMSIVEASLAAAGRRGDGERQVVEGRTQPVIGSATSEQQK